MDIKPKINHMSNTLVSENTFVESHISDNLSILGSINKLLLLINNKADSQSNDLVGLADQAIKEMSELTRNIDNLCEDMKESGFYGGVPQVLLDKTEDTITGLKKIFKSYKKLRPKGIIGILYKITFKRGAEIIDKIKLLEAYSGYALNKYLEFQEDLLVIDMIYKRYPKTGNNGILLEDVRTI